VGFVAGRSALFPAVFGEAGNALTVPFRNARGDSDEVGVCCGADVAIADDVRGRVDSTTLGVDLRGAWGSYGRVDEALRFGLASFGRGDFGLASVEFVTDGSIVEFSGIGGRDAEVSVELSAVANSVPAPVWELPDAVGAAVGSRTA